jgi:hypothetical protein
MFGQGGQRGRIRRVGVAERDGQVKDMPCAGEGNAGPLPFARLDQRRAGAAQRQQIAQQIGAMRFGLVCSRPKISARKSGQKMP